MLNYIKIWITVALAIILLAGCSNEIIELPDQGVNKEEQKRDVFIRFQMKLSEDGVPFTAHDHTRAGAVADDETPGTDMENVVKTVGLFVYDASSNLLVDYVYLDEWQITQIMSEIGLTVPIYAKAGQNIYIYAAVNPTERMRYLFSSMQNNVDLAAYSDYTDYWDVINEFVPGTGGHQTALEHNKTAGIPMTGIFKAAGRSDNVIPITGNMTQDNPQAVSAEVSRIVAKMHVLATTKTFTVGGSDVQYVYAEDNTSLVKEAADAADQYANWIGWVRLADVRYMPNSMNKSTYIFPHYNQAGKLMDLNMDLMPYVNGYRFNRQLCAKDFVYYDGISLHSANISPAGRMAQAEEFDQTRLDLTTGTDDPNRYTQGMYSLENYFDNPANGNFLHCAQNDAVIPMITHLSITARLTPRNIVVAQNYATKMDDFIKVFKNTPDYFYRTYGLTPDDFSDDDVARWENILKERYFGATTLPDIYRNDFRIIRAKSEADAADLINWSMMANNLWSGDDLDFEKGKYPALTFYVYDTKEYDQAGDPADDVWTQRYLYLTAGAVNIATNHNIRIKTYSVPHVGGWGYYYTYLDQLKQAVNNVTPYTSSQVTRNTYYLAIIKNLGSPGGTITRPEFIKVNTVPVSWVYDGRGDLVLH